MAGTYDGSIRISTKVDNSGFNKGLQEQTNLIKAQSAKVNSSWNQTTATGQKSVGALSAGMGALLGTVGKVAMVVGAVFAASSGLINMGQQAIELASSIQEVENVVTKAFGNMRREVDELADTSIEKLGMSRLTAYQTASTFMSMGKSMVDSMEDAKDMALNLTRMTANMSSFFNIDQNTASTALKSIYTGETETLKQFGVVMTEVNLQQFAYEQGIRKSLSAMSQSEKVMLRYMYVMEQLGFIGDDFEDTQDSWANQTRILSEQWNELLSILGGGLIAVLTPVVQVLNEIVSAMIDMAKAAEDIIAMLGEIRAEQMEEVVNSTEAAADAMEEYGNAIAEAEEQAGKLAAFDDIDVLASDSENEVDATTPALETPDVGQAVEELQKQTSKLMESLKKGYNQGLISKKTINETISNLESIRESVVAIFDNPDLKAAREKWILESMETAGTALGSAESVRNSIADGITGGIKEALEDPKVQGFAQKKLTSVFGNLAEIQESIQGLLSTLASMGTVAEGEGFKNIVSLFTKLEMVKDLTVLDKLSGFSSDLLDLFAQPVIENGEEIKEILENVLELFSNITEPVQELLDLIIGNADSYEESLLHKIMQELVELNTEDAKTKFEKVNEELERLIELTENLNAVREWCAENVALGIVSIDELLDYLQKTIFSKEKWAEFLENPKESFEEWWDGLEQWWAETISDWLKQNEIDWFSKERWDEMLYNVGASFGEWWTGIVTWWSEELPTWWDEDVSPWFTKEKWLEMLANVSEAAEDMWDDSFGKIAEELPGWYDEKIKPWFTKEKWKELGAAMRDGIYEGFKNAVYKIVDILNAIINAAESGLNGLVDSVNSLVAGYNSTALPGMQANYLSKVDFGSVPYPHLAQGAVIPPNHQFLAVLGDQTSGLNIETPLATMEEAFQNVYDRNQSGGAQEVTIRFEGTMSQLVRAMKPHIIAEQKRTGRSFRIDEGGGLI